VTGRFLSPDTVIPSPGNPQALNRYSYVYNNPIVYRDPSGHFPGLPELLTKAILSCFPFCGPSQTTPRYHVIYPVIKYALALEVTGQHVPQALELTLAWYFETGAARREYGQESEVTQFLKSDRGVQQARATFAASGSNDMTFKGNNAYRYSFGIPEFLKETLQLARSWADMTCR
jgi:hypothetical protein